MTDFDGFSKINLKIGHTKKAKLTVALQNPDTESVKDTTNSDALSNLESPKTGDEFNLAFWLSLSIISLAGLAFTLKYKKSHS